MLHVHRAERADGLVEALGALIAEPLGDPFATEVVSVPTRGMERWLAQQLSLRLGVCANVDFPSPHRVVNDAIAAACGVDPDADPWRPERSTWPLLEVVEQHLDDPWLAPLRQYLGDPSQEVRRARRLGIVRHVAELYDRYALHRPDMVRGWLADPSEHWQAQLFARLRNRIASESPAERLARFDGRADLPPRLSLFGLTRLPTGHLHVLERIAEHRDVHLFLLHPSPVLWRKRHPGAGPLGDTLRAEDPTTLLPDHPLLASWGRDSREMQLVLARARHEDHHHPVAHREDTLLARVQADVRADRPAGKHPHDRSLEVHACHGRARQVEVLRDAILHLLEEDPTLEPRDVVVMCPDIETFAPLIQATFGAGELGRDDELALPEDARPIDLRVRLADRSLRQTNPVLGVVAQLLDLAGQRITASQVLDLADREAVRRRFRFDDDDLTRLQAWIAESGIRWGLDSEHRSDYKLQVDSGTWRFGLDRLLAGVTMTEDRRDLLHGILPLDDVESGAIDLAGRLAELVARLDGCMDAFSRSQPIDGWARAIADAADALAATRPRDAWQRGELQRILDEVTEAAQDAGHDLALTEVRTLLAERLQGRPTRANFRTGHLTICTLVPMRSVPHRVVCLLGLDDGVFPRKAPHDGDDLMLEAPRIGERDPRAEDRQLLLDALLAAQDKLIITFTGNDERTNAARPPAVPVGELLDLLPGAVLVRHPLQPFDPRNFTPDELVPGKPWSFDGITLRGANAVLADRVEEGVFLPEPLPPLDERVIELDELVRFVEHPVRRFLRRRLGVDLRDFWEEIEDDLDIELDGLGRWGVGDRLLQARLAGIDARAARRAEIARGKLPPGQLGRPAVLDAEPVVEEIAAAAGDAEAASVEVRVDLGDGRSLRGTVPNVCDGTVRTATFSRIGAKQRAVAWVRLLALTADDPSKGYDARTIGRAGRGVAVRTIAPVEDPLPHLQTLVSLYERGMREPLPLVCRTSAAWVERGLSAARDEWESGFEWDKEDKDPEHLRVFGGRLPFEELMRRPGFDDLAHELWDPILARESG